MMKVAKQAFILIKENMLLIQPVLIYLLVMNFAINPLLSNQGGAFKIISLLTAFLLSTALVSGWFYMVKAVAGQADEPAEAEQKVEFDLGSGKRFFIGVGDYFLSASVVAFLNLLLFVVFIYLVMKAGMLFLERPDVTVAQFKTLAESTNINSDIFKIFTREQITQINLWTLYLSFSSFLFSFLTMYFMPAVFYEGGKNPFRAIFNGLKFLFMNFGASLFMMIYLSILGFIVTMVVSLGVSNVFVGILGLIMLVYYICFYVMLIILFYEKKQKTVSYTGLDSIG